MSNQTQPATLVAICKDLLIPVTLGVAIGIPGISLVKMLMPELTNQLGATIIDLGAGAIFGVIVGVVTVAVRHFTSKRKSAAATEVVR